MPILVSAFLSDVDILITGDKDFFDVEIDKPEKEESAVLEWANSDSTALMDIMLLITLFTGRDVFAVEDDFDENGKFVITADHNYFYWGGSLRCAIPFEDGPKNDYEFSYRRQILESAFIQCWTI